LPLTDGLPLKDRFAAGKPLLAVAVPTLFVDGVGEPASPAASKF